MPSCHHVIKHGSRSQNVCIKPKIQQDDLAIICKIAGGDEIKVVKNQKDTEALWHIALNSLLQEPLITIYVNDKPLTILADTGSKVNYISYQLVKHLGLVGRIRDTKSNCCGPNGSPIETNGEIYLEFFLENQIYNTKFIVLQLARSTAGILGYQFMKTNNVSIHCGKSITNDPN